MNRKDNDTSEKKVGGCLESLHTFRSIKIPLKTWQLGEWCLPLIRRRLSKRFVSLRQTWAMQQDPVSKQTQS